MNDLEKQALVRQPTRKTGKKLQIRESREIGNYFVWNSIEQMVRDILPHIEGLQEWSIEMETDYGSYGDRDRDVLMCSGWRDATKAEVEIITEHNERKEREQAERVRLQQEAEVARLKRERPDLFPTTFVDP